MSEGLPLAPGAMQECNSAPAEILNECLDKAAHVNMKFSPKALLHWLNENLEKPFMVVGLLMSTLLVCYQVFYRYIWVDILHFQGTTAEIEELSIYAFIMASMFAISLAARQHKQVAVTLLLDKLPDKSRILFTYVAEGAFLIMALIMAAETWQLTAQQISLPSRTPGMKLPYFVPYLSVTIGFTLLSVRLIQNLYDYVRETGARYLLGAACVLAALAAPLFFDLDMNSAILLVSVLLGTMLLGVPIAAAMGLSAICVLFTSPYLKLSAIAPTPFTALDNFSIPAVFFFICSGVFMSKGGVSRQLIEIADMFLGKRTGGLALVTIAACTIFAAICGSGPATVAAIGSITIPAMVERGYSKAFSVSLVAVAGSLGNIIPPSNTYVLYGILARTSIGDLFMAGIVPGLLMAGIMMVYAWWYSKRKGWRGVDNNLTPRQKLGVVWQAKYALLVPVIILGGIYSGLMTATESAGVAAFYGLLVGMFVYRGINRKNFIATCLECCLTSGVIIFLIAMANGFGFIMTMEQIPTIIANFVLGLSSDPVVLLLIICLILTIVGMLMEAAAAMIILVPVLLPIINSIGMNPIQFGIVMTLIIATGFVTPPVGVNLFVANAISGEPVERIAKNALPLVILICILILFVTFIPWLSLCLL